MKVIPVIMAGGSGSRLWPMSRKMYPKQFLPLIGGQTMLQRACLRAKVFSKESPIVICNEDHRFLASEEMLIAGVKGAQVILEPQGKNTAPAIALAANKILLDSDAIMMVLSADHYIPDFELFAKTVGYAAEIAESGDLVTFGIEPSAPSTGYGYIKKGVAALDGSFVVDRFVEKPTLEKASEYLAGGEYLWNSGMFMFKASAYLDELKQFEPKMFDACQKAIANAKSDEQFIRPDAGAFSICPDDSIDYAIMERTQKAKVVPYGGCWSDVGSWSSLWDIQEKDSHGNASLGEVSLLDTKNSYVDSREKLTAVLGLEDVVVVDTKDALLVAKKDRVQDIKTIVEKLKKEKHKLTEHHRDVYRPWGKYDSIDEGSRYQVKRITVKPGAKLSVQMHHHRAEHWIVVSGTANVTIDGKDQLLAENESVYIPIGAVHALENPGKIPLELIEVQSGAYLGEDDIVRFEDRYGRV